jgi:hypothetical protein
MTALADLVFLLGVSCLLLHELDAIHEKEWRFFFMPVSLEDESAYRLFVALHLPLFFFILWNIQQTWLQIPLDIFLVVHGGLHLLLRNHRLIAFDTWFSWLWIYGGALIGLVHLLLLALIALL